MNRHWPPQGSSSDAEDATHPLQIATGETLADLERLVEQYEARGMIRPKGAGQAPHVLSPPVQPGALSLSLADLQGDDHHDHSESRGVFSIADDEGHADHGDRGRVRRPGLRIVAIVTGLALIGVAGAFANKMWSGGDSRDAIGDAISQTVPATLADNNRSADLAKASPAPADAAPAGPVVPDRETQVDRAPKQIMPASDPYGLASSASSPAPRQAAGGAASTGDRRVQTDRIAAAEDSNPHAGNDPAETASAPSGPAVRVTALDPARASGTPQTSQPSATPQAAGTYVVQLSSQRTEAAAQATSKLLETKYPTMFAELKPFVRRSDLAERGVYYRAQVGPFATFDSARQFCGNLKKAGGDCVVQKN